MYVLKRDPVWLKSLPHSDTGGTLVLFSGDGGQVALTAVLLLAASPLVRNILTEHLPLAYSQPVLSLPAVTGDVLQVVGDMLAAGTAADVNLDRMGEVEEVFKMLMVEASLVSFHSEDRRVGQVWDSEEVRADDCIAGTEVSDSNETVKLEIIVKKEMNSSIGSDLVENMNHNTISEADNGKSPNLRKILSRNKKSLHGYNANEVKNLQSDQLKNNKCSKCFKHFSHKSCLTRHIDTVHEKKEYPCHLCAKKFNRKVSLARHIGFRHKKKKCTCPICSRTVAQDLFNHHMEVFHNDAEGSGNGNWIPIDELEELVLCLVERSPDNKWHCTKCSYRSRKKFHVRDHVEIHIEGIQIPCGKCEVVLSKSWNVRYHMRTFHPD